MIIIIHKPKASNFNHTQTDSNTKTNQQDQARKKEEKARKESIFISKISDKEVNDKLIWHTGVGGIRGFPRIVPECIVAEEMAGTGSLSGESDGTDRRLTRAF